jgi:hypothetical protein
LVHARKGRPDGFRLGERYVTYQQLQALPTETEALRKQLTAEVNTWIDEAAEEAKTTARRPRRTTGWSTSTDVSPSGRPSTCT